MNKNQLHSTDISRIDFDLEDDPQFTLYTQRSFAIAIGIGFFLSIGLIAIGVHFGEYIDAFLKTKTGFWTLVGVVTIPGITWAIMKVRAMIQEK